MAQRQLSLFPRMIIGLVVVCLLGGGVMGEAVGAQSPTPGSDQRNLPRSRRPKVRRPRSRSSFFKNAKRWTRRLCGMN